MFPNDNMVYKLSIMIIGSKACKMFSSDRPLPCGHLAYLHDLNIHPKVGDCKQLMSYHRPGNLVYGKSISS